MKIAIAGAGYVGLSLAVLLAKNNNVIAFDLDAEKINKINQLISPIKDNEIEHYLTNERLDLSGTTNAVEAFKDADYIIISTPTDYDPKLNYFDTSSVEVVIKQIMQIHKTTTIVIKSTVPIGFTEMMKEKYGISNLFFSPEFLREGHALYDNLYPSRIILGSDCTKAKAFAELLVHGAEKEQIPIIYTKNTEAEAIKLFANTYLAMRVSFFNELDTYAELRELKTEDIIKGISLDPRIGEGYNNPSFGYGGYCLPKDSKQLLSNYKDVPNDIIRAIVESNHTRKNHIVNMILKGDPSVIGVYRLTMKTGSDNFRSSSIQGIIQRLKNHKKNIIIFEPTIMDDYFDEIPVERDLKKFKDCCDIIIANRISPDLYDVVDKVYTRDIFHKD